MGDTSITKTDSSHSPHGEMGQKYLASGITVSMRLWKDEQPAEIKPVTKRDYETFSALTTTIRIRGDK